MLVIVGAGEALHNLHHPPQPPSAFRRPSIMPRRLLSSSSYGNSVPQRTSVDLCRRDGETALAIPLMARETELPSIELPRGEPTESRLSRPDRTESLLARMRRVGVIERATPSLRGVVVVVVMVLVASK